MRRLHARLATERERRVQRQHARIDSICKVFYLAIHFQILAAGRQQDISVRLRQEQRCCFRIQHASKVRYLVRLLAQKAQIFCPCLRAGARNALGDRCRVGVRRVDHQIKFRVGEHLDDPVNRLLNALEPGTYLRPHRHLNPKKDEIFLLLRGRIAVFLFDNKGEITQTQILDPKEGVYGAEIKAGTWHGLLVLESGSVIYEIKEGPFAPLAPENFAPWSPAPEDTKGVAKYMELLGKAI